jgi:hypothetical protein
MQILALRFDRLELHLDLSGALWFPGERALAVADLHLEKGSSYARHGQMLPPYDSALTLRRLHVRQRHVASLPGPLFLGFGSRQKPCGVPEKAQRFIVF